MPDIMLLHASSISSRHHLFNFNNPLASAFLHYDTEPIPSQQGVSVSIIQLSCFCPTPFFSLFTYQIPRSASSKCLSKRRITRGVIHKSRQVMFGRGKGGDAKGIFHDHVLVVFQCQGFSTSTMNPLGHSLPHYGHHRHSALQTLVLQYPSHRCSPFLDQVRVITRVEMLTRITNQGGRFLGHLGLDQDGANGQKGRSDEKDGSDGGGGDYCGVQDDKFLCDHLNTYSNQRHLPLPFLLFVSFSAPFFVQPRPARRSTQTLEIVLFFQFYITPRLTSLAPYDTSKPSIPLKALDTLVPLLPFTIVTPW
ncbi:hypothetical protein D9758_001598 [Tetrapyrgos nigripes]|uniref:Uncharacterized protein n=1 Tax=Tetrapyrgos nigripes TaxID=182062 RepID=A0A8H5GXQ4_9AGAR|nr:hypothetical protein D9758_001598 [Tetrapyrgos nigripes]